MDQKCIIIELCGGFLLNKKGYPTIIHFIFRLPGQIELIKLKIGDESESYADFYGNSTKTVILLYFCVR